MGMGRQNRIDRSRAGFTLVELMVAMGLSGLLALGLASLMTVSARQSIEAQRAADFEDEIDLFEFKLRTLFAGMTRVEGCGCGGDVSGCQWSGADAPSGRLLLADFEMDPDPTDSSPLTGCPIGPDRRGCKRSLKLWFDAPTPQTDAGGGLSRVGSPGAVKITYATDVIARLEGVTSVQCGFLKSAPAGVSAQSFRLFIRAKTRTTAMTVGPAAELQGWDPTDPGFSQGILRWLPLQLEASNLSQRGMMVLSTLTTPTCTQDGMGGPVGSCCSGYQDATKCLSPSMCSRTGSASRQSLGFSGVAVDCCSHQDTRGGRCARTSALVQ